MSVSNWMSVLVLVVFFAFAGIACFIYSKTTKKREEREMGEQKKDPDLDSNAVKTQMGMYTSGYEGISNRQKMN